MAVKKQQQTAQEGEEMVEIRLPLSKETSQNRPLFVRVNGRTWGIPKGQRVMVPKCVEEVIETSEELQLEAIKYSAALQNGG